jgi:hypothetical protein
MLLLAWTDPGGPQFPILSSYSAPESVPDGVSDTRCDFCQVTTHRQTLNSPPRKRSHHPRLDARHFSESEAVEELIAFNCNSRQQIDIHHLQKNAWRNKGEIRGSRMVFAAKNECEIGLIMDF